MVDAEISSPTLLLACTKMQGHIASGSPKDDRVKYDGFQIRRKFNGKPNCQ